MGKPGDTDVAAAGDGTDRGRASWRGPWEDAVLLCCSRRKRLHGHLRRPRQGRPARSRRPPPPGPRGGLRDALRCRPLAPSRGGVPAGRTGSDGDGARGGGRGRSGPSKRRARLGDRGRWTPTRRWLRHPDKLRRTHLRTRRAGGAPHDCLRRPADRRGAHGAVGRTHPNADGVSAALAASRLITTLALDFEVT